MRHSPDDPATMTPERRRREVVAILAQGALRLLRPRRPDLDDPSENSDAVLMIVPHPALMGPALSGPETMRGGAAWR
jgi:hypothetical protein